MAQSQTTDQPMAPQRRAEEHQQPHASKNTIKVKQSALSLFLREMYAKQVLYHKTNTPQTMGATLNKKKTRQNHCLITDSSWCHCVCVCVGGGGGGGLN